jgi:hypothetical protein
MRKMKSYLWIVLVITSLALSTGCAQQGQTTAPAGDSATGLYEDKELGFSIKYPASIFSEVMDLTTIQVLNREASQRVPALTVRVSDIPSGLALENVTDQIKKDLKAEFPASKRHKVTESNMIKLESGIAANKALIQWRYQGSIPLLTAYISVYKNGKLIQVTVTSVPGQPTVDQLFQWAEALKVSL